MVKILKFVQRFSEKEAEKKIHEIATKNSRNVIITDHARERMEERGFVTRDLLGILCEGYVDEPPVYDEKKQNWVYKITKRIDTVREAGVITTIVNEDKQLVVVTIEWEIYK